VLDQPPLDRHLWGVAVLDGRGKLRFGRNAERLFTPASNAKLVVAAVAAARLGPDWTVTTSVYPGGPVEDGVVRGDLVLYGRGDPTWASRCFAVDTLAPGACQTDPLVPLARLAGELRRRGIRLVQGDVVGDGSAFEPETIHPTWENDDLAWAYAAPVSGLGFNENAVGLIIAPGDSLGSPARVAVEPALTELEVESRLVTVADSAPAAIQLRREEDGRRLVLSGTVRRSAPPRREAVAVPDGNRFAAAAFRRALADSGVLVLGRARGETDSLATAAVRTRAPLAELDSRPLADWIFPVLNVSQNWYAEMVLKQLGRVLGDGGGWRQGLSVERRFLIDSVGIDSTQFLLHDGSGLSAKNLISPLALAKILVFIRGHPRFAAFGTGLPRSGQVGSLRTRFVGTSLEGRVRAKTGSIGQVNSLSGFVEAEPDPTSDAGGREPALPPAPQWVFSIQANHHTLGGRTMIQAIDSVVVALEGRARRRR
jgi:D-alanyl-D-alanine carboxypeptidase/D-alanyl-D-alanine-endopeptidase (penicillin-binding protein 4)